MANNNGLAIALHKASNVKDTANDIYHALLSMIQGKNELYEQVGNTPAKYMPTLNSKVLIAEIPRHMPQILLRVEYDAAQTPEGWMIIESPTITDEAIRGVVNNGDDSSISSNIQYTTPLSDFERMISAYLSTPHDRLEWSPSKFVRMVEGKIDKDVSRARGRGYKPKHWNRHGIEGHLTYETHHYLKDVKKLCFNETEKRFEGLSPEQYNEARKNVTDAFVNWAITFFQLDKKTQKEWYLEKKLSTYL